MIASHNIIIVLTLMAVVVCYQGRGQELYISPADPGIEELLNELAIDRIITLNSVARSYSREFISRQLKEALKKDSLLSRRQISDILFYLGNYSMETRNDPASKTQYQIPDTQNLVSGIRHQASSIGLLSYDPVSFGAQNKDFVFSLRPMVSYTQYMNENGAFYSAGVGSGIMGYLGRHVALAATISRTFEDCILSEPPYFTQLPGGNWTTYSNGSGSFVEWTGQLTYSWKWGSLGIYKDHFTWGDGYHGSNYFSGRPPAFPFLKLHLKPAKWIEFNFIHAWLSNSEEDFALVDDLSQYPVASSIHKHIAANLLTFIPWRGLDISFGNSVVYDGNEQLAYFTPFFFYKSVDATLSSYIIDNENSQMFLDISSRQIKHLHLYLSLYVDEFMISRLRQKNEHNFLSWKGGLCLSNFPIRNLSFILEGTRTLPMTYQHYIPTVTFASDGYNLGNYLIDNAQESYAAFIYKPFRRFSVTLSYNFAEHGDEFQYGLVPDPTELPVLKNISWQNQSVALNGSYSLVSGTVIFVNYQYSQNKGNVKFNAPVFTGTTNTVSAGFMIGF
jgi:hypothetical protein